MLMKHLRRFNESYKVDPEIESLFQIFVDEYGFTQGAETSISNPDYPTFITLKVELTDELIKQLMRLKTKLKLIKRDMLITIYTLKNDKIEHQIMDYYSMNSNDILNKLQELVAKPTVLDWHKSYVYMEIHVE